VVKKQEPHRQSGSGVLDISAMKSEPDRRAAQQQRARQQAQVQSVHHALMDNLFRPARQTESFDLQTLGRGVLVCCLFNQFFDCPVVVCESRAYGWGASHRHGAVAIAEMSKASGFAIAAVTIQLAFLGKAS
jgi:hypothetical protein